MSVVETIVLASARRRLADVEAVIKAGYQAINLAMRDARILLRAYVRLAALREHPAFHDLAEEIRSHGYAVRDNPRAQAFRLLFEVMTEVDHPENVKPAEDTETRLRRIV